MITSKFCMILPFPRTEGVADLGGKLMTLEQVEEPKKQGDGAGAHGSRVDLNAV